MNCSLLLLYFAYILKHYCDEEAYGSETIEAFSKKEDALKRLKEDVEESFDLSGDDIPDELESEDDDTFEEDYVSIYNEDGGTSFWIVEELDVKYHKSSIYDIISLPRRIPFGRTEGVLRGTFSELGIFKKG